MGSGMKHFFLLYPAYLCWYLAKDQDLIDGLTRTFGALSKLIIIHISCDSAEKEKEANIASIQLTDSAVYDNKSHTVKLLIHIIRFRVCFVQVDNELWVFFFFYGLSRLC